MSKSKKITFGMIAADMPKTGERETIKFNGVNREFEIEVRKTLDFKDAMGFVRSIAATCADVNNGEYTPELFDFTVRVNTLIYYAGMEGTGDAVRAYDVAYRSGIYGAVVDAIDDEQYGVLLQAAKALIGYSRESIIAFQVAKVNELIEKMDEVMREGDTVVNALSSDELNGKLEDMMRIVNVGRTAPEQETAEVDSDNIVKLTRE